MSARPTLPNDLRTLGCDVIAAGEGEHILPAAIVEQFTMTSYGAFEPATANSTKPIASTITHAGICKVQQHTFDIP